MKNERDTERIVREHFAKCRSGIRRIDEQAPKNPRIRKLLKSASKSGPGKGFPEFLIEFEKSPDFLIVVECKADPLKHCSPGRDRYADFAVDGALLYASYLNREFDVLAIGVSGTDERTARVSHYLLLKNDPDPKEMFGGRLLPPGDYLDGCMKSPHKRRQDYDALLAFIRGMNARLHVNKVSERNRALLISAILIALERESFRQSYAFEADPKNVADLIVDAVARELSEAGIEGSRLAILKQKFGFLPVDTVLTTRPGELVDIIRLIDAEVNSYIRNHQYRDVLGGLYTEFLQYANSDKGLGIVLTPPHIADFFTDLAQVNKESVAYDNCAGTGGFLIHALGRMVEDARGDEEKIRSIRESQIFGVELQSEIYPLALSNMYIHQDGKSNILLGDCFSREIMDAIKEKKPTVGLLNPPYKSDKKNDIEELEFVLNNLECLQQGGTCVAIVPMQCALATRGRIGLLKRRIMEKHTLEAVFSMPDELFFNSDVGVVSCVMAFTAHRPHPANKEAYLGYCKDDGFVKRKTTGRSDLHGRWEGVKRRWLDHYVNKREAPGLGVKKRLGAEDEWVAEAYMETDYSKVTPDLFIDALYAYSAYLFSNRIVESASSESLASAGSGESLDAREWEAFPLSDLFGISGTRTTLYRDLEPADARSGYPYVTTQATNNGVKGFCDSWTEAVGEGGVLTIDSAVAGYCAWQNRPFSASDHVEKLTPKFPMNECVAMFLTAVINIEQYRYNYGRKCSQTRLRKARIRLPATPGGAPDWEFMERCVKSLPYSANLRREAE